MAKTTPYGMWKSPISTQALSQRVRMEDVQWHRNDLIWMEGRSDRSQLVYQAHADGRRDLLSQQNPRGTVGYGGGDFCVMNDKVIFADRSGRLFRQDLKPGSAFPITPTYGGCASPSLSPDGAWVVYVFSDGETDLLALVDSDGKQWPQKFSTGADFYMQPAWHPSGKQLAWVEWNHPNMPWDGAEIKLASWNTQRPEAGSVVTLGGSATTAAQQPIFSPDGRWLAFVEAGPVWDNLVIVDLKTGTRRFLYEANDRHLCLPAWVQGQRTIAWMPDSQSIAIIFNQGAFAGLMRVDLTGQVTPIDTGPYTWLTQLSISPTTGEMAFIASSPSIPTRIVRHDGTTMHVIARSDTETTDPAYYPTAQPIQWTSSDGQTAHGLFFGPSNPDFTSPGLPPVIVNVHGGPTSVAPASFSGETAYFTSRGYAVVYVNYRGSTGYGHPYRSALNQAWGDVDVEDTRTCLQSLGENNLADPQKSIIMGGSAGGYTVLNVLCRYPGVFKAGVDLFGVSNLFTLDLDTHKFESHYTKSMVGELPTHADRYRAWSPIFHAANIRDALIVFQGAEDKVVPPAQSEEIVAAVRRSGVPLEYTLYPGEGHGFRKSETIADYLQKTERFLMQQVLFAA